MTPRGGRDGLDGWAGDAEGRPYLKARVAAPPVGGEANAALIKLIAKGVAKSAVTVAAGETARVKTREIEGITDDELIRRLGKVIPSPSRGEGQG